MRVALNTAHYALLRRFLQLPQLNIQKIHRTLNCRISAIIANLSLRHPIARLNLHRNDIARDRHGILLRHPILRPTQQHIATLSFLKPPKITLVSRKKAKLTLF